jgi:hypothetical protein
MFFVHNVALFFELFIFGDQICNFILKFHFNILVDHDLPIKSTLTSFKALNKLFDFRLQVFNKFLIEKLILLE